MRKQFAFILGALFVLSLVNLVYAAQPQPHNFWDTVKVNSISVDGTTIVAYNESGEMSSFDNPSFGTTPPFGNYIIDVFCENGAKISFKSGTLIFDQRNNVCAPGDMTNLNLTATDADNDGYSTVNDCNDNNAAINPGTSEIFGNGIDDDCNASTYDNFKGTLASVKGNIGNLSMTIDGSNNLNQFFTGAHEVKFYDNGTLLFEFTFDFTGGYIDFTIMTINKNENSGVGSIVIGGLDLGTNNNKTVYFDNKNGITTLCIKDANITSVTQISSLCDGANEFSMNCQGSNGKYNCTFTDATNSTFKITGLRHSGAQQQSYCGDGACNSGEDCASCSSDCGSCPTSPTTTTTGGGGGGGGPLTSCVLNGICESWETPEMCPSDCKVTTTTVPPTTTTTAPATTTTETTVVPTTTTVPETTTTTPPAAPTGFAALTGILAAAIESPGYLILSLIVIVAVLAVFKFKFIPSSKRSDKEK